MNNATVLGVQTDDGSVAFTRRGDVRATEIGLLELGNGRLVLDDGGNPITVPADTIISIGTDGTVYGRDNQNPQAPPAPIALLMLRDASATPLVRRFDGLYDVEDGGQADACGPARDDGACNGAGSHRQEGVARGTDDCGLE